MFLNYVKLRIRNEKKWLWDIPTSGYGSISTFHQRKIQKLFPDIADTAENRIKGGNVIQFRSLRKDFSEYIFSNKSGQYYTEQNAKRLIGHEEGTSSGTYLGRIEPFIGKIKKKAIKNIKIDKNEVEKFLLIPLKFFYETKPLEYKLKSLVLPYEIDKNGQKIEYFPTSSLGLPKTYHEPWGNDNHKIWVYKWEDEVIWGITSMLIIEFLKKFNKIK